MTEIKTTSKEGLEFIADEEGLVLHPYKDSVGIPTIGIGSTYYPDGRRVQMSDKAITLEEAYSIFSFTLKHYEKAVWSLTRDDINQHQFDALTSLCYNIGVGNFRTSTVLKKVNINPYNPVIKEAFEMWQNAGNKKGILLGRRRREAKLYFK